MGGCGDTLFLTCLFRVQDLSPGGGARLLSAQLPPAPSPAQADQVPTYRYLWPLEGKVQ